MTKYEILIHNYAADEGSGWEGTNGCQNLKVDADGWCVSSGGGCHHGQCKLVDHSPENIASLQLRGII